MPITSEDKQYFGHTMEEICEARLPKDEDGWYAQTVPHFFHNSLKRLTQVSYPSKVSTVPHETRESPWR